MKRAPTFLTLSLFAVACLVLLGGSMLFLEKKPLVAIAAGEETLATAPEQIYFNSDLHYTITYPSGFTVNPLYSYKPTGPGKAIPGVSFTIPLSSTSGTNLAPSSFLSVESLATTTCSVRSFLGNMVPISTQNITDKGIAYIFAKGVNGKRNQYEEYLYIRTGTRPCIAVRYFIQYTNMTDYIPGTVQAFNHDKVLAQLDSIRESLKLNQ